MWALQCRCPNNALTAAGDPEEWHCHLHLAPGGEGVSLLPCCCCCNCLLIRHYSPAGSRTPTSTFTLGRMRTTVRRMPTGAAWHHRRQCAEIFQWRMTATATMIPRTRSLSTPKQGGGGGTTGMAGTHTSTSTAGADSPDSAGGC